MRGVRFYHTTPDMAETLQDRLRARMNELNLSENGLAVKAGLSRDAVRNIFRGRSEHPRSITLQALARVLRCSVQYLIEGNDPPLALERPGSPAPVHYAVSEFVPTAAVDHGVRLRRLRLQFDGGSVGRAAEIAGVSESEWMAMEEGRHPIGTVALGRFCEHHQIGPAYVVTGSLDGLPSPLQRGLAQAELAEMVAQARMASAQQDVHRRTSDEAHSPDTARQTSQAL
jgi:DNA-binding XRE family transcriptional regulator